MKVQPSPSLAIRLLLRCWEQPFTRTTHGQLWLVLLVSEAAIAVLDVLVRPFGLFFAPLYFFPICCACWRLGLLGGVVTGTVSTALVAVVGMAVHDQASGSAIAVNFLVNSLLLSFVATIVVGFRYCYDQQQHLATHDRMTGALSRQTFYERLEAMLDHAGKDRRYVLLLYFDIDGFKAVNDCHGHQAGDEILQAFAIGAVRVLRQTDAFGRMGGDEFTVAMLLASPEEAHNLAESLQKRFSALLAKSGHAVTCSMGALIVPSNHRSTAAALMKAADQLMYKAKQGGRNRVCIASAA